MGHVCQSEQLYMYTVLGLNKLTKMLYIPWRSNTLLLGVQKYVMNTYWSLISIAQYWIFLYFRFDEALLWHIAL